MLKSQIILCLLFIALFSCKHKQVVADDQFTQEAIAFDNHFNSLIEGKIVKREKMLKVYDPKFKDNYIVADVQIMNILRKGQNYHGQFEKGDTVRIFFNFTLENTTSLFPELNQHLPGLKVNDVFKAELEEKASGENPYSIYLYRRMK